MIAVLGAGIAGLSTALELVKRGVPGSNIIVVEREDAIGGLAQTKKVQGFSFDLGPHRWFTKVSELDALWDEINCPNILEVDRLTRIWYKKRLFNYPLKPVNALANLGLTESAAAIGSYAAQMMRNRFIKESPANMEEAFVRQFGVTLYQAFFREYNLKLWGGQGCRDLSPDWVKQRVKGLSLMEALLDALGVGRKDAVISLIDRFKYPELGTGQLSDRMASRLEDAGCTIMLNSSVRCVYADGNRISGIQVEQKGISHEYSVDYCISSIPVDELAKAMEPALPDALIEQAGRLRYRHLIFVVLFVSVSRTMQDNWLYVQDSSVSFNRFMDMANWNSSLSPEGMSSLVFEITCDHGDAAWNQPDEEWIRRVSDEYCREFGFIDRANVVGGVVYRKTHAYPVYTLDYKTVLDDVKTALRRMDNLQLIGRNGLFRYNNMDHSMATGCAAAKNFLGAAIDIDHINLDDGYHEEIRPAGTAKSEGR